MSTGRTEAWTELDYGIVNGTTSCSFGHASDAVSSLAWSEVSSSTVWVSNVTDCGDRYVLWSPSLVRTIPPPHPSKYRPWMWLQHYQRRHYVLSFFSICRWQSVYLYHARPCPYRYWSGGIPMEPDRDRRHNPGTKWLKESEYPLVLLVLIFAVIASYVGESILRTW